MMRGVGILAALVASSAGSLLTTDFTSCGKDADIAVSSVSVSPVPVEPGKPLYVSFTGVPEEEINGEGVEIKVSVSLFGITIAHETFDMCSDLQLECPLPAKRPFTGILTYITPDDAPPGMKVKARVEARGENAPSLCVEVELKIAKSAEQDEQEKEEEQWGSDERVAGVAAAGDHGALLLGEMRPRDAFEAELMDERLVMPDKLLAHVNSHPTAAWRAGRSHRFAGLTAKQVRRLVDGTVLRGEPGFFDLPAKATPVRDAWASLAGVDGASAVAAEIPKAFDAREAWPECADIIGHITDQSDCGSCWAFASTEAFNDRYCIATGAKDPVQLSAEDTLSCCRGIFCGLSMGCNGGQPGAAWSWFRRTGVVSGGDYSDMGQGDSCKPYEFQPCAHHVDPKAAGLPACPPSEYPTPACRKECSDATFNTPYEQDKRFASSAYKLRSVEEIQEDLMRHGPVTAAFSVYEDFLAYAGGVYEHVTGGFMGGHAVKILGWGTDADSGKDYWLVANSWNVAWGEKGLFRILRGVDEAGIESQIVAGEI